MTKRTKLLLTGVGSVLKESAEKKLEQETDETPKCDRGYTREWYEDMGIEIPQELKDREKKYNEGVELLDEDFEEVISEVMVYEDQVITMVESDEITTIFLKSGITITVLESVDQIYDYIEYCNLSWWDKNYNLFLNFFRRKFGSLKN